MLQTRRYVECINAGFDDRIRDGKFNEKYGTQWLPGRRLHGIAISGRICTSKRSHSSNRYLIYLNPYSVSIPLLFRVLPFPRSHLQIIGHAQAEKTEKIL